MGSRGSASTSDRRLEPRDWTVALRDGMRALLQGRFDACERLAREAGAFPEPAARLHAGVQVVALRREQGRAPEAAVMARDLLDRNPSHLTARATLAALLGDLGRDREARTQLAGLAEHDFAAMAGDPGWLPAMCQLAGLCALVEAQAEAETLYRLLLPYASVLAEEPMGAACHGSVSRYLGLLAHSLGRCDEAAAHFTLALADHERLGAPVLAAHTRRQYSYLLRARGRDDDWELAIALLGEAEATYRRLGIDGLAGEAQAVLARSQVLAAPPPAGANRWCRQADQWELAFGDRVVRLADTLGLRDLARLVGLPGRSVHAAELWAGTNADHTPDDAAECRARLAELDQELAEARRSADPIRLSLAESERDFILGELTAESSTDHDPAARARRLVGLRIRLAIDRVGQAHPELGQHLRHAVRTGTMCVYEPAAPISWTP